jgi:hypothetical protein
VLRTTATVFFTGVLMLAATVPAQPKDGDVVLAVNTTNFRTRQFTGHIVVYDPGADTFTTLAQTTPSWQSSDIFARLFMSDNNSDLLDMRSATGGFRCRRITPSGILTTILTRTGGDNTYPPDLMLGGDGRWLMVGPLSRGIWHFDERTLAVSTLFDLGMQASQHFLSLAPCFTTEGDYWILNYGWQATHAQLFGVTRRGIVTTLLLRPPAGLFTWATRIRTEPHTGAAWVARDSSGYQPGIAFLTRRSAAGVLTTLVLGSGIATRHVSIAQDGTLWAIRYRSLATSYLPDVLHHLTPSGTTLRTRQVPGTIPTQTTAGATASLELYGRLRLTVRGPGTPGSTATVQIVSLRPGDGGRQYQLACSLARQPSLQAPNGEWLHVAPDPLFFLSVSGTAPQVFRGFSGVLSASGRAAASIHVPTTLPGGLDLPVFVAGVVYDRSGIRTVMNTHWLMLQ